MLLYNKSTQYGHTSPNNKAKVEYFYETMKLSN